MTSTEGLLGFSDGMSKKFEFNFRVWVHPEDGDTPEIEVFYAGLESTKPGLGSVTEWARESLSNENFYELFVLDESKYWQVVGRCMISGSVDYWGEYDEELRVLEFEKEEVPEQWILGRDGRELGNG